jgi:TadE-like protein
MTHVRLGSRDDARRLERGVATVEAVLVVPLVLVPVLLSIVVFGHLEHTKLVLDAAAAAGARQAAVAGADSSVVRMRIRDELQNGGVDPRRVRVTIDPLVADWGDPIRVRLDLAEQASIPFIGGWSVPLFAEFVTRSEVTH